MQKYAPQFNSFVLPMTGCKSYTEREKIVYNNVKVFMKVIPWGEN